MAPTRLLARAAACQPTTQGTAAWGLVVCFLAFYNGAADLFIEIYGKVRLGMARGSTTTV